MNRMTLIIDTITSQLMLNKKYDEHRDVWGVDGDCYDEIIRTNMSQFNLNEEERKVILFKFYIEPISIERL